MGQSPLVWQPGVKVEEAGAQMSPMLQSRSLPQAGAATHRLSVRSQNALPWQSASVSQPSFTWHCPAGLQKAGPPSCGQAWSLLQRQ